MNMADWIFLSALSFFKVGMPSKQQQFGTKSEALAVKHLKKLGYKILERNFRTKLGEIDIIAKDRDAIVFVEVKARNSGYYGNAKWGVTSKKQMKISMVALQYLKDKDQSHAKARFDVVAINSRQAAVDVEIIKNAFELAYR